MKLNTLLLGLITLTLAASTSFANWTYPQNSIVFEGNSFSMRHVKKSYEQTINVIDDALTPEDFGMIAFDLMQETEGFLCAMESIACDPCSMYYDRVTSMRHDAIMDLVSIYVINLSFDDACRKHRLFTITQLIVSSLLKSPCLQQYYPCLTRFIRNSQIQIIYCRGMKAFRLEGQDLGIFINTLLDMIENPKQCKIGSEQRATFSKSSYDCCGRQMEHSAEPAVPAETSTQKPAAFKPKQENSRMQHLADVQSSTNQTRASNTSNSSSESGSSSSLLSNAHSRFETFGDIGSFSGDSSSLSSGGL